MAGEGTPMPPLPLSGARLSISKTPTVKRQSEGQAFDDGASSIGGDRMSRMSLGSLNSQTSSWDLEVDDLSPRASPRASPRGSSYAEWDAGQLQRSRSSEMARLTRSMPTGQRLTRIDSLTEASDTLSSGREDVFRRTGSENALDEVLPAAKGTPTPSPRTGASTISEEEDARVSVVLTDEPKAVCKDGERGNSPAAAAAPDDSSARGGKSPKGGGGTPKKGRGWFRRGSS